jgi:hypothetical protein
MMKKPPMKGAFTKGFIMEDERWLLAYLCSQTILLTTIWLVIEVYG